MPCPSSGRQPNVLKARKRLTATEFGIDVRLPGMKIAAIAISPVLGGRAKRVNEQAALAVRGVRQVVNIDEAVAVVADHMWAAKKGLKAAAIEWDEGTKATNDM